MNKDLSIERLRREGEEFMQEMSREYFEAHAGLKATAELQPIYAKHREILGRDALELTRWFLLPKGEEYQSYQILRYETGKPRTAEVVTKLTDYMADDPSIIAFKLALVKAGYTFEVTWFHK